MSSPVLSIPTEPASKGAARILHTMLRVGDLERSLAFYTAKLGMRLLRREDYPEGEFSLAFVGYRSEKSDAVIELTFNWGESAYDHGGAFGHIAIATPDLAGMCERLASSGVKILRAPGPMKFRPAGRETSENIAFVEDPDGYKIELIEVRDLQPR